MTDNGRSPRLRMSAATDQTGGRITAPRSQPAPDLVLVDGVLVPKSQVVAERMAETLRYYEDLSPSSVPERGKAGAPTDAGPARSRSVPSAQDRVTARLRARMADSSLQVRLYRFKKKRAAESAASSVREIEPNVRTEVCPQAADGSWHLKVQWRTDVDPSKLNRRVTGAGGEQISHHEADEELRTALELIAGVRTPAPKPVRSARSRLAAASRSKSRGSQR